MIADYENIEYYFNDDIIKKANKISKSLKKTNKGLTIIHGERGVGKTTLVNYIVSNIDKIVIFIPCTMIESTINNPDFRNFIKRYKNSVIVLDDSELYFGELYSKSNIFTNNLLQLVDGFQSDDLDLNIITVLNVDDIDDVDHILFDSNNLIDIVEIGKLKKEKAQELNKFLGSKVKIKNDVKLVDVLKKRNFKVETGEIGFN
jgi:AAA+ ATPase superfamily predicted ATPase